MRITLSLLLLAGLLLHGPARADDPPSTSAAPKEAGTPRATAGGTTFTLPPGWTATQRGPVLEIRPPETDLTLGLTDVDAKDASAAVAAAWSSYDPSFKRAVHVATPAGPRDGWEQREFVDYEVSPNEKLVIAAFAWRANNHWLVGMLRASEATREKRAGPLNVAINSLRPKGYQRESFAGRQAHPIDAQMIATMKAFVADGMTKLKVPGVGFSLIDGGKVVFEGGIGVRELGAPEPIDADTLFMAASNTKALSTLLLAELVDEKKLRWDEPVTEAYPSFRLGDAATTQQVQIKDLVCACTGMPRQDLEWIFQDPHETPRAAVARLADMQPTSKFGEVFQYSNLMAGAAGFIGGTTAFPNVELGHAYDEAMQRRIFTPLGMTRTTFDYPQAMQGDWARPHDIDIDGHLVRGDMTLNYTIIPLRPAGAAWTSPHDLSRYVMMELAKGKLADGSRLVSEQNLLERRKPNVAVSDGVEYGMGLIIDKRWGVTVVHHGGDLEGYHSDMLWLPDYNVGAVILTNSSPGFALRAPFARRLVELLFDGKPEAAAALAASATQLDAERAKDRERLQVPPDAAASAALAGKYHNDTLGRVLVAHQGKQLIFTAGNLRSEVASRKNDDGTTSFITISPNVQGLEFVVGAGAKPRTLIARDAQHEYVFTEQ
ncbi:MAG TPA: serine hydrolase domain-containing protein [Steroidobacteraceae bacterium]|nr:serine hydrolase domain-containing protein [Steroidobacteraceae bacterium]